eukprot:scaffold179863_cov17-Tisochrysis_lutea.AAC.1
MMDRSFREVTLAILPRSTLSILSSRSKLSDFLGSRVTDTDTYSSKEEQASKELEQSPCTTRVPCTKALACAGTKGNGRQRRKVTDAQAPKAMANTSAE